MSPVAQDAKGPIALAAMQACQRVWLQWIVDGQFNYHQNKDAKEGTASGTLAAWMNKQYLALIKVLLEQLRSGDGGLQVAALHVLIQEEFEGALDLRERVAVDHR